MNWPNADLRLDRVEILEVTLHHRVDFALIGLAVFPVGLVVALNAGLLRTNVAAKACRLGPKSAKLSKALFDIVEGSGLISRHERLPFFHQRSHRVQIGHDAVSELCSRRRVLGCIYAARFHDDRSDEPVESFAVSGTICNGIKSHRLSLIGVDGVDGKTTNSASHKA